MHRTSENISRIFGIGVLIFYKMFFVNGNILMRHFIMHKTIENISRIFGIGGFFIKKIPKRSLLMVIF